MSKISNVENDAVYEGYDSVTAAEWCTPSFLGCSVCVGASAVKGQVSVSIGLKTPFGNVSKTFSFNANVSYTWQPFSKFKITVSITNFNEADGVFSFDLGLNPCVDVPFMGWKCYNYSHHFVVPVVLAGIHNNIDDSQFASMLALHAGGALKDPCHCDDHTASSMFHGDIYNAYLKGNTNVPTIPVAQCIPIPTRECIPTITSCVTGIWPVCLAGNDSNAGTSIPTIPVAQCIPIPTRECIPTITSCVTGIWPVCLAGNEPNAGTSIPTIPVAQCIPIPTRQCVPTITSCVTGIWPVCSTAPKENVGTSIPTVPVAQCIPIPTRECIPTITSCVTGIWPVCSTAPQGSVGTATPTVPVAQCIPTRQCVPTITSCVTGMWPICSTAPQGNVSTSTPTVPVAQCIPTRQCVPTITSCVTGMWPICSTGPGNEEGKANAAEAPTFPPYTSYPTLAICCMPTLVAGCKTGIAPLCESAPNAGSGAIPTLPVNQCVNTMQCVPTLSCIPTTSCTGIPYIC